MMKPTRKLLILTALLLGLGLCAAPQAEAGWWHGYGYGYYGWGYGGYTCCSPCWTPVCSVSVYNPCCDGWYLGVRPGPIRRALFGPYRWYHSGYGYGYGCCSLCYCDPCCCSDGGYVTSDAPAPDAQSAQKPTLAPPKEPAIAPAPAAGTPNEPALAPPPAPAPMTFDASPAPTLDFSPAPALPADPALAPQSPSNLSLPAEPAAPKAEAPQPQAGAVPPTEGTISILVPEDAQVVINGYVTKSTGRVRRYVSQNLKPGLVYPFNIQVNVVRDGRTLTDSRQVKLVGGTLEAVVFNFDKTSVHHVAQAW